MERGGGRNERGQGTLEYSGIVLLAAILAGAVVYATGWGHPIRESVESSICEIVSGGSGNCGFPDTALSPEERATSGDYVALGDSYSSGEGADDYLEGTNDDDATKEAINDFNGWLWPGDPHNNICRRSANAYSAGVYDSFDFEGDYIFGACSGGVVKDYYEDNTSDNEGEGPQRDHITDDTSLITMGMGGNDFGFGSVMKSCVLGGSCATEEHAEEVDADIDAEIDELAKLYRDMEADAPPGARILIVGPHLHHVSTRQGHHDRRRADHRHRPGRRRVRRRARPEHRRSSELPGVRGLPQRPGGHRPAELLPRHARRPPDPGGDVPGDRREAVLR